jgi:hypothetical protein
MVSKNMENLRNLKKVHNTLRREVASLKKKRKIKQH